MPETADAPISHAPPRDHGGNLDAAMARFGGTRSAWLDLSTGINPVPYPLPPSASDDWTALPDANGQTDLIHAARAFWRVPAQAQILAAPGASALIARVPALAPPAAVQITPPTYNEHAAAFSAEGWQITARADNRVLVHPNNPDGRRFTADDIGTGLTVIDESFCDVMPEQSLVDHAARPGVIVLKSFGKFWGLAGMRLGFAIAAPEAIARLTEMLGPWPVSGPALRIGASALRDTDWAKATSARLAEDRQQLDQLMTRAGADVVGGTDLFGLYRVPDASAWQERLAQGQVWSRIFPYADDLIRLGLPAPDRWAQLEAAL